MFQRMQKQNEAKKKRIETLQNELKVRDIELLKLRTQHEQLKVVTYDDIQRICARMVPQSVGDE